MFATKYRIGDSIEYALSLKAIIDSGKFENLAVAFVGRYRNIFKKYFNINNIYDEVISEKSIKKYDTVFHLTLEINELAHQKYNRQNIEQLITNYFSISKFRSFKKQNIDSINKISIFPISTSPIRTMTVDLLNHIIIRLNEKVNILNFEIERFVSLGTPKDYEEFTHWLNFFKKNTR